MCDQPNPSAGILPQDHECDPESIEFTVETSDKGQDDIKEWIITNAVLSVIDPFHHVLNGEIEAMVKWAQAELPPEKADQLWKTYLDIDNMSADLKHVLVDVTAAVCSNSWTQVNSLEKMCREVMAKSGFCCRPKADEWLAKHGLDLACEISDPNRQQVKRHKTTFS